MALAGAVTCSFVALAWARAISEPCTSSLHRPGTKAGLASYAPATESPRLTWGTGSQGGGPVVPERMAEPAQGMSMSGASVPEARSRAVSEAVQTMSTSRAAQVCPAFPGIDAADRDGDAMLAAMRTALAVLLVRLAFVLAVLPIMGAVLTFLLAMLTVMAVAPENGSHAPSAVF